MPDTQKVFGIARPAAHVTWEDMAPLMQTEAAHVWSRYEQDVLREAWIRTDALGAVYVLEATSADAACVLREQPMAKHGLVAWDVVPVGPFTPLSLLFGTQPRPIAPASSALPGESPSSRVLALDGLRPEVTADDLAPHLADEAAEAWSLWKAGIIRENYLRTDRPGAVLMLETAGAEGARAVLDRLPLVRAGLIEFECLSLSTFMGFDALFEGALDDTPVRLDDPTTRRDP